MSTLQDLVEAVNRYMERYRHPAMPKYTVGKLYDLCPNEVGSNKTCESSWPDTWPNCHDAGIYAILDIELNVLYIGKSSMQGSVGARLSSYFVYGDDRSCNFKHEPYWTSRPRFVWTVAVPESTRFEAPALEEYLIRELRPRDNTRGVIGANNAMELDD